MTPLTPPYYADDGTRLTDCCQAHSTYPIDGDGTLCCKACWKEVPVGQGDGSESHPDAAYEAITALASI
jgi:hypothetical protein